VAMLTIQQKFRKNGTGEVAMKPTNKQAELFEHYMREQHDMDLRDIRTLPRLERLWFWMRRLNLGNWVAITLDGRVYMRIDVYNRMPAEQKIRLLYHEFAHLEQQKRNGFRRFKMRYIFRRSYRLRYEIEAFRNSIQVDMFFDGRSNAIHYAEKLRAYRAREPEVLVARKGFQTYIDAFTVFGKSNFTKHWERAMNNE
jgi:hypothetical protein